MTGVVVEVGPATVRGPAEVPVRLVTAALECIDDEIALLDDQPVAVDALWGEVLRSVLPDSVDMVTLICPTWWPSPRVERVRKAASATCSNVVVLQRAHVVTVDVPGDATVVEIAADFVVVVRDQTVIAVEPRLGEHADIAGSVAEAIDATATVFLDAPVGVAGAPELGAAIAECLRADGVPATPIHADRTLTAQPRPATSSSPNRTSHGRRMPRTSVAAAVISMALLLAGLGVGSEMRGSSPEVPMTLLVEGRVAVKVPASWTVQRVVSGPGSARVEVTAPGEAAAVLVTQSRVRRGETLSEAAKTLRGALDDQRVGVFSGFNPQDRRGDRPAATYRELREGRHVDWAVFVDGGVRIGIGCQSTTGDEDAVRYACEEAVRSAHALV